MSTYSSSTRQAACQLPSTENMAVVGCNVDRTSILCTALGGHLHVYSAPIGLHRFALCVDCCATLCELPDPHVTRLYHTTRLHCCVTFLLVRSYDERSQRGGRAPTLNGLRPTARKSSRWAARQHIGPLRYFSLLIFADFSPCPGCLVWSPFHGLSCCSTMKLGLGNTAKRTRTCISQPRSDFSPRRRLSFFILSCCAGRLLLLSSNLCSISTQRTGATLLFWRCTDRWVGV